MAALAPKHPWWVTGCCFVFSDGDSSACGTLSGAANRHKPSCSAAAQSSSTRQCCAPMQAAQKHQGATGSRVPEVAAATAAGAAATPQIQRSSWRDVLRHLELTRPPNKDKVPCHFVPDSRDNAIPLCLGPAALGPSFRSGVSQASEKEGSIGLFHN